MSKQVKVLLGKDGSVRVEAFGFKGTSCEEATAFIDRLFGKKKVTHKDSYNEVDDTVKTVDGLPSGYCG